MTSFFDARCEPAINEVADQAVEMINQLFRESARPRFDLAQICFWAAQAVAPDAGLPRQLEMGRLAQQQVRDVMNRLCDTVAA